MKNLLAAFFSALLFGLGLGISGMTLPSKVHGFLDVGGAWDPSLLLVMAGAVLVHSVTFRLITRRESPVLASQFHLPKKKDIDWKLVLGSAIFGIGWGLGGFCPGPALVGVVTGHEAVVIFVVSMIGGIYIHQLFDRTVLREKD